jgi:hypothetical protein
LWITSRTRSGLVQVTSAMRGTGMPWADSSRDLADDVVDDELSHRVGVADMQTDG